MTERSYDVPTNQQTSTMLLREVTLPILLSILEVDEKKKKTGAGGD